LGLLGRFTTDGDGRLDLKRNGLLPIVTAARTLALKHAIRPTSTIGRLNEAKARAMIAGDLVDRAIGAYGGLMRMVLEQQIEDAHRGIPVSARVPVAPMTTGEKRWLKTAFKDIGELIGTVLNVC
jgi:DNA polymerase-3 subunit epsilon/CBS domain-containing protein